MSDATLKAVETEPESEMTLEQAQERIAELASTVHTMALSLTVAVLKHGTDGRLPISNEDLALAQKYGISVSRHPVLDGLVADIHRSNQDGAED